MAGELTGFDDINALENILRVGTSAGWARAKAIPAWNPKKNEFRSGQFKASSDLEYWIMKFDGFSNNRNKELVHFDYNQPSIFHMNRPYKLCAG